MGEPPKAVDIQDLDGASRVLPRSITFHDKILKDHRAGYERTVLGLLVVGGVLAVGGQAGAIVDYQDTGRFGALASAVGAALFALSLLMAYPLRSLRSIGQESTGGTQYDRMKNWPKLKVSSIFLNLLVMVAGIIIAFALLSRGGLIEVAPGVATMDRLLGPFVAFTAAAACYAFYYSIRAPTTRQRSSLDAAFFLLMVTGGLVFAAISGWVAMTQVGASDPGAVLRSTDGPFYALAAFAVLAHSAMMSRAMPTLYGLFVQEHDAYTGGYNKRKSVLMPTMIAFALLFLVLFFVFMFEVGVVGLVEEVPKNAVFLGLFAFIFVALIVSVTASLMLSKAEDTVPLYKTKRPAEAKKELWIISASAVGSLIFLAIAGNLFLDLKMPDMQIPTKHWLDFFSIGVLIALGPYGFYYARRAKRTRELEDRFPDFLRDLAASRKAGLTLESSVKIASRGEYGPLSPEIQKMADQLSWNVPFDEALERFSERVRTPLIQRAVSLITEASRSGGHVTDVLMAAATDAREIKKLETERRGTMMMYTVVIYIAFLVFLGVVSVLYGTFLPEIVRSTAAVASTGSASIGSVSFSALNMDDFRTFFFMAAMAQGLGNGIVAGMMETGRGLNGLRHSFIMVAMSYVAFGLLMA